MWNFIGTENKIVVYTGRCSFQPTRDEETGGIQPTSMPMGSHTDNLFSIYHFVPIISTFYNNQA